MLKTLLAMVMMVGCVEQETPEPDPIDGVDRIGVIREVPPETCSREPSHGCCDLLPDMDAFRECSYEGLESGSCGVAVCWEADCSMTLANFCVP